MARISRWGLLCAILFTVGALVGFVLRPLALPLAVDPIPAQDQVFRWTFQLHGTSAHPVFPLHQQWAEDIKTISGGRLQIAIHPVNTVVPLMESLTAVTQGTLDGAIMWGPFWTGIDPSLALSCGQTSGLTALEHFAWLHSYGGLPLVQAAYARHNIHWLPAVPIPAEVFLWAHRPITEVADLTGLKLRAAGYSLDVFSALGAAATFIPGGETPPALMKRAVDAGEFGSLAMDVAMGFHEAARYAMVGARAPVINDDILINKARWRELPPDLQTLLTTSLLRHGVDGHSALLQAEQEAKQIALDHGTVFVTVSDQLVREFRATLDSILDRIAADNPEFATLWQHVRSFRTSFRNFRTTLHPWE